MNKNLLLWFLVGLLILPFLATLFFFFEVRGELPPEKLIEILISLFTFLGIMTAVLTYIYNKNKDERVEVISQIAMFRENIIPAHNDFLLFLREHNLKLSHIKFNSRKFKEIYLTEGNKLECKYQYQLSNQIGRSGNLIFFQQIEILNLIEEFALRVLTHGTQNHAVLVSLHSTFVQSVESHVVAIFRIREIEYGVPLYENTIKLYLLWRDKIDRSDISQRITPEWAELIAV